MRHLLKRVFGDFRNPIIEMTKLSEKYGEIYSLQLGSVETVVVTSMKLIRHILLEKGSDFGNRPNFLRYNVLFNNDKENCELYTLKNDFIHTNIDVHAVPY
jgi:hypothetical protein